MSTPCRSIEILLDNLSIPIRLEASSSLAVWVSPLIVTFFHIPDNNHRSGPDTQKLLFWIGPEVKFLRCHWHCILPNSSAKISSPSSLKSEVKLVRSAPSTSPFPLSNRGASPRPIHDDANADQTDQPTDQIEAVRPHMVDFPAPENRQYHENAAIGCIDATKMGWLESWDDSIKHQND